MSIHLVCAAIAVMAASGLPACLFPPKSAAGQRLTAILISAGAVMGLAGAVCAFVETAPSGLRMAWGLPWGEFHVAVDPLNALFLGLVFIVSALGSVYALGYWKQAEHPENGRRLGVFYGLLAGSMALVLIAQDGVLFLVAWEIMALSAYFAATVDGENPEVRKAGWVYLVATHIGTLCLFGMFALWKHATGSFDLQATGPLAPEIAGAVFVLAVAGFGFKAGFMPLHVWLPGAHAHAPSHVSALMSGVMLKMGIFGILRITSLFGTNEAWWGVVLLVAGGVTGLAAILFALGQHDLKRILAYSSIENIGIIGMGMGLALLGRAEARWDLVMLGLAGSLFHAVNHGLFKPLLFFNAGAIIHATGTRETDRMGGLAGKMPAAAILFLFGAVAISALPPFNGFVSEWFVYLGLFRTLEPGSGTDIMFAATAAVALAMIGTLAVACFVKLFGTVYLGTPRTGATAHAHDPGTAMTIPMALLAAACLFLGLCSFLFLPVLERAVIAWGMPAAATGPLSALAPVGWINAAGAVLVLLVAAALFFLRRKAAGKQAAAVGTWDCGYARPTARMQYTGSSFSQAIIGIFKFLLWPKKIRPEIKAIFPEGGRFTSTVPDAVLDRLVLPLFRLAGKHLPKARLVQQGQMHLYMLYILIITIILLVAGRMGT